MIHRKWCELLILIRTTDTTFFYYKFASNYHTIQEVCIWTWLTSSYILNDDYPLVFTIISTCKLVDYDVTINSRKVSSPYSIAITIENLRVGCYIPTT